MSKVPKQKVEALKMEIKNNIGGYNVVYKDNPDWYKSNWKLWVIWLFVSFIGLFSSSWKKSFLEDFSNGIGNNLVFPNEEEYWDWQNPGVYKIVRHEYIHMRDYKKHPFLFVLSYILPPLGLTFRAYWELRGYTATMLTHYEIYGEIPDELVERIAKHFTSASYLWMLPSKKWAKNLVENARKKILNGEIKGFYF